MIRNNIFQRKSNQFSWIESVLSYFFSRKIEESATPYYLELRYSKDRLVLNSQHANQSNESLKMAFHYAFHELLNTRKNYPKVLLLGLGLGSTLELLSENSALDKVIAYENDPRVLNWVKQYYSMDENKFKLRAYSANKAIEETELFDLILLDLFEDRQMPDFLNDVAYWKNIFSRLSPDGQLIWNTMSNEARPIRSEITELFDRSIQTMDNRFYTYQHPSKE